MKTEFSPTFEGQTLVSTLQFSCKNDILIFIQYNTNWMSEKGLKTIKNRKKFGFSVAKGKWFT